MTSQDSPSGRPPRRIGLLKRSGQAIFALEKRIAFDGAAAATAAHVIHHATPMASDRASTASVRTFEDAAHRPGGAVRDSVAAWETRPQAVSATRSVVFIESDVPDLRTLINGLPHSAQIVVLDASKDGVAGIADYLDQHKGVQNVYIFSHGSDAHLDLGTADLDTASMLGRHAADLATIRDSLGQNANILVYGCDFAEHADGDSAAHLLSRLTGASVAASTNLTGSTKLGGDFVLEDRIGSITAPDVLAARFADDYSGVLATQNTGAFTINTGTSGTATSATTVATATTADGNVKIVVTVTPNAANSANSITTKTTGATFDTTAPASAYPSNVNGAAALEETLQFGGTAGGTDGANSATITIAYFDARTGNALVVTNPTFDIDRVGGSATNASNVAVSDSSDLTIQTSGATLTRLSGSSSAFNVTSSDIYETINTVLGPSYTSDANADPTMGTAAGAVQINGSGSTFTLHWAKASGSLNGGDRIDFIFNADTAVAQSGTAANRTLADGQSGVSIDTASSFSNPSGLPTTYGVSGLPAGLSIDASTGLITGTVDHDASKNAPVQSGSGATLDGTYTVTVTATNSANSTATQTFTIDATNTAPVVGTRTPDQTNRDGDMISTVDASAAFSDPNGDPLTYTATNLPAGLSIDPATGHITGRVAANAAPGTDTVTVTATDDKGAATTETFAWTVQDVPPTAAGTLGNRTYADGTANVAIDTAGGFANPNGLTLAYAASGLPAGLSINTATGRITGTVDHDASQNAPTRTGSGATLDGTYTITVTANDGQGGTATQTFTLDATNTAPTLGTHTADQSNQNGDTITPVDASAAFSDPNGDPLIYSASGLPAGLSIDAATGHITGSVAANATPGRSTVTVTATDDKGAATTETFAWRIADAPPTASTPLPDRSAADAAPVSYTTANGFANPNGLTLAYAATGLPTGLTINATTGVISGTLDRDASIEIANGLYTIAVTADDGQGGTATNTFHLTATNTAPVVGTRTPDQTNHDGDTITAVDASAAFSDPNGDPLTYTATNLPAGLSIDAATGHITGRVAANAAPGTDTVTVTATDDKGAATTETFAWTVQDVPPTPAGTLGNRSYADGTASVAIDTAGGFSNPNGLPLAYAASGLPAGLSIDATTGRITGTVDHDASQNAPTRTGSGATLDGQYTVTVTANDGQGGTATQTFTIDATNTAPVVGTRTPDQTNRDGDTITAVDASAAFSDPNGDPLTYTASGLPAGLTIDATTGHITGRVATNAAPGTDTVTVTATDDKGAATTETFAWRIADAPPTASTPLPDRSAADAATVSYTTADGFANPNGLTLAYAATGLPTGLTINATTGVISGTLDHDASIEIANGVYTIAVTADDGQGGTATNTFHLTATNTAPVVGTRTPDQTNRDGDTITAVDASAAFSDPNGDPLTYTASGLPAGLTIDAATGHITGRVAANAAPGTDTVTVTATDDKGAATTETFAWTIQDVPPTATGTLGNRSYADGTASVAIDTAGGFSNPNGLPLAYAASGLPAGLSIDASTGRITGTVDHDASQNAPTRTGSGATLDGQYTVTVTANDGQGGTATQTFTIDATNTAPVVGTRTPDQTNHDGDTITAVDASVAFSDPNGDPLTYTATNLPAGLSIDAATGYITGRVAANAAPGTDTVTVTATDDKGAATTETFAWRIADAPPTASTPLPDRSAADAATVSYTTADGFTNPNGLALTYAATGLPTGLTINATTGVISGTLDHDASIEIANGVYTIAVTANDGQGGTATNTFHLTATNTAPVVGTRTPDQTSHDGDTITAVDASAAFSDPNGDPLTYTASGLPAGLTIDATTGHITGRVAANAAPGIDTVTVTATDDKGAATTETFAWTIQDVPPTATGTLGNRSYADGTASVAIDTAGGFANPNGLTLAYAASGLPAGLSINTATGRITGTVDHDASQNAPTRTGSGATLDGQYTVTVTANDGQGGTATQTFTIDATNTAPVVGTRTPDQTNRDGDTITAVDASAAFSDPNGDPLTYTASGLPAGLTIDATTGHITGRVAANAAPGTDTVTVTATDDKGAATTETFAWTVQDVPPTATGMLGNRSYADGTASVAIDTAGGFSNPNGLPLAYAASGLPAGLSIDATTGRITGTVDHDASKYAPVQSGSGATLDGTYTVTVTATNSANDTATQTFTIDATNTAPVVGTRTPDQTNRDGDTITAVDASAAFSDPNGDPLTYAATNLPAGLSIDATTGHITGRVATNAAPGTDTVTVTATDDKGAVTTETFAWRIDSPVAPVVAGVPFVEARAIQAAQVSSSATEFEPVAPAERLPPAFFHADDVLLDAVNGLVRLDGLPALSDHNVVGTAVAGHDDDLTVPCDGPFPADRITTSPVEYLGSSMRLTTDPADGTAIPINVETLVRDRLLVIAADDRSAATRHGPVALWEITSEDGSPLPGWLHDHGHGMLLGGVPSGVQSVDIRVKATLRDGTSTQKAFSIDTKAGHIKAIPIRSPQKHAAGRTLADIIAADTELRPPRLSLAKPLD